MKKIKPILWICILFLFLDLLLIAYRVTYTRFYADDFCAAGAARVLGVGGMWIEWYTTWTGRFMFLVGIGLFGLAGPGFAGWIPVLAGIIWFLGLWWAFLPLTRRSGWESPRLLALLAAGLSLLVLFSSTPNLFQSFFWQNGMVNYTLPLIGFTFTVGILLRTWLETPNRWVATSALFVLAFLSGGFTEAFSALQVTFFSLLVVILFLFSDRRKRKQLLPVLVVALLGALLAMLIVIVAPGNAVRLQYADSEVTRPGVFRIITFSLRNMTHIIGKYLLKTPLWALASILPPFLAGWLLTGSGAGKSSPRGLREFLQQAWVKGVCCTFVMGITLVTAACAPVVFAMSAYPDDRTIFVPQFIVVLASVGISALLGMGLRQSGILPNLEGKPLAAVTLHFVFLITIAGVAGLSIWQSAKLIPEMQANTSSWEQSQDVIQQAILSGQDAVTVTPVDAPFGLANLSEDPNNWVNQCAASYYGIGQIISK